MSRITDLIAATEIARHCTDSQCRQMPRPRPAGTAARRGAPERHPPARTPGRK